MDKLHHKNTDDFKNKSSGLKKDYIDNTQIQRPQKMKKIQRVGNPPIPSTIVLCYTKSLSKLFEEFKKFQYKSNEQNNY